MSEPLPRGDALERCRRQYAEIHEAMKHALAERDAARAEVERLRERMEVAIDEALHGTPEEVASILRDALEADRAE